MSDNLIKLQDKRISELEKKLAIERAKRDNLVKATKSKKLSKMTFTVEKQLRGWRLVTHTGVEFKDLDSLDACLVIIKPYIKRAQFRQQSFVLHDINTDSKYEDYRVYTEWVQDAEDRAEKDQDNLRKNIKRTRRNQTKKVQAKTKQIDTRIFDRTY